MRPALADTIGASTTGTPVRLPNYSQLYLVTLPQGGDQQLLVSDLNQLDEVALAEVHGFSTEPEEPSSAVTLLAPGGCANDPHLLEQWHLEESVDHDIDACEAWAFTTGHPTTSSRWKGPS